MPELPESVGGEIAVAAEASRRAAWLDASAALARAGSAAAAAGWGRVAALCTTQGATLRRCAGDPARVFEAIVRGHRLGGDPLSRQFRGETEAASALDAAGEHLRAAEAYDAAARTAVRLDLPRWMVAALQRRRADLLLRAGDPAGAWRGYDAAAESHRRAGDAVASGWVDVAQANRACAAGELDRGLAVASRLELQRSARTDAHLRAELGLARGRLWLARGDRRAAAAEGVASLDAAVEAGFPASCYAAAWLLIQVLEAEGDRAEVYALLESTLEQLVAAVDAPLATAWMRVEFEEARARWGEDHYEEIRAAHARARRGVLIPVRRRPFP